MAINSDTYLSSTTKALNKQNQYNDAKYAKKSEVATLAGGGGGVDIVIGTTQPANTKAIWLDTTGYTDTGGGD